MLCTGSRVIHVRDVVFDVNAQCESVELGRHERHAAHDRRGHTLGNDDSVGVLTPNPTATRRSASAPQAVVLLPLAGANIYEPSSITTGGKYRSVLRSSDLVLTSISVYCACDFEYKIRRHAWWASVCWLNGAVYVGL
ncbi:hypothetical protein V7S43_000377 [Phytophthora oleae]|uniref:Uncharacterized protein n=1 Tax=Phytophthora oleae TaxID=2107226 RepID=A0ABD3G9E4_9STRA